MPRPQKHILVCTQSRPAGHPRGSCGEKGCGEVFNAFLNEFMSRNLWGTYALTSTGCLGTCSQGTAVLVYPEGVMYGSVKPEDAKTIIDEHLLADTPVERLKVGADIW